MNQLLSYAPLLPEIIVAVGAMALLMLGVFGSQSDEAGEAVTWLSILVLAIAGYYVIRLGGDKQTLFEGAFVVDGFARFMKVLVLVGSAVALLLSVDYLRAVNSLKFEYPVLVLLATVGMLMMVSANDLISLYVSLELQSLALYVVAAFRRDDVRSSEAGLKYFVLGALSSGMLLYGASLIYGFTGTTSFAVIANEAKAIGAGQNLGLMFGLVFLLVGVAFKISAVPFHMWTPDVYEGSPTPVTAFFAAAPKMAAMALLVRVILGAFPALGGQWQQIIGFLALASMVLGAFAAIGQTNIKRLMAYSSIGHVGFALVGLTANNHEGVQGVLVYLSIYLAMTLGTFACILAMRRDGKQVEEIEELAGLAQTSPGMAFVLGTLMFSLAGIPPLAGFWAKWYAFLPAIKAGLWPLAIIGVIASVIGAYYYLRIVKIMFFDEPKPAFTAAPLRASLVMGVSVLFVLLFILPWIGEPIVSAASAAARTFL